MWIDIKANRVLYVHRGRDVILCDRGHSGEVEIVVEINDVNRRDLFKGLGAVAVAPTIMEHIPTMRYAEQIPAVPYGGYWYGPLSQTAYGGVQIPHLPAVNINLGSEDTNTGEVILTDIGVAL